MGDPSIFNPVWIMVSLAAAGILVAVGKWIGAVNSDRAAFKGFTERMRDDIKEIRDDIKKMLQRRPSETLASGGPLRPTDLGGRISESLNASELAADLAAGLRSEAEGKHAYDIQELSFRFIRDEYRPPKEIEDRIKQCAYDNGLDRDEVLDVLAVEIRDKLLAPDTAD